VPDQWSPQQYDLRAQQAAHAGYTGGDQRGRRAHRANTIAAAGGLTQALRQERHTKVVKPRPQSGWRKAILVSTFGLVNPGESRIEREDRERRTRVCANVSPPFMFAVLSGKGGAAKTTTTAGLGSVFAKCRGGGEVVVVDVNPDEGNLASRVNPDARHTFKDVLAEAHIGSRSAIRKYTASSPTSQLDVLASSDDLVSPPVYTQDDLTKTIATLSNVYNVIGIDCGNDFRSPVVQRVLDTVTAVVVVTGVQFDSGKAALRVHDYLVCTGRAELVQRSFLIMSEHTPVTQDKLRADIEDTLRPTVWKDPIYVPHDEHLYEASVIDLDQLKRDTGRAYLEAAAKLSDWYGAPPVPVPVPAPVNGPAGVGR
jgi:MinD-like ATPase involved in chromosome partitioning or flagellar assembly